MKKVILILIALVGTGIVYLAVVGSKFQEIKTEIEITAPPSKVWPVITDVNNWKEWSPIIKDSNGTASVGSDKHITRQSTSRAKDARQTPKGGAGYLGRYT